MTRELDLDTAVRLLDELVEEKGADYVYPSFTSTCVNTVRDIDGTIYPSCIVGHVVARAGVPLEDIHKYDRAGSYGLLMDLKIQASESVKRLLSEVQSQQDGGRPWGAAVEFAKGSLARHLALDAMTVEL